MEKTINYKGYEIKIEQDDNTESPREWDNMGTMVCFHRRYNLGDKHDFSDPDELREFLKENKSIALPLFLYDHGGVTMSTGRFSCPWDSGQVGWIYVTEADARKEYGWKKLTKERREKIEKHLEAEVSTFDDYITGNVYGYRVVKDGEETDSCWGYIGDPDKSGLIEGAKSVIDYNIKFKIKDHLKTLKKWIISKTPIIYRTSFEL